MVWHKVLESHLSNVLVARTWKGEESYSAEDSGSKEIPTGNQGANSNKIKYHLHKSKDLYLLCSLLDLSSEIPVPDMD